LKYYKDSLQEQASFSGISRQIRASFLVSRRGSATVEASLLTPIFLCAICSLIAICQLLIISAKVQYATSQTLRICVRNQSLLYYSCDKEAAGRTDVTEIFYSVFEPSDLCQGLIEGGSRGIKLSLKTGQKERETIEITASYCLRVPIPFASRFRLKKRVYLSRRLATGYVPHTGGQDRDDPIVYIAENGTVYHTHMDCSHICLKITDGLLIKGIVESSTLTPCEYCARGGGLPSRIYVTANGDHYHTSLACSGLKRTVKAVPLSKVKGMRRCSRCARRD